MGNITSRSVGTVHINSNEYNIFLNKKKNYKDLLILYLKPDKKININSFITNNIHVYVKQQDGIKNYNINITKQRQRVVTKDKILYKYGSDGIHIFENDHYILVNSKDIIDTIVCITKNNII